MRPQWKSWVTFMLLGTAAATAQTTTPYNGTATAIPGFLKPENFDEGGNGFAYYISGEYMRNGSYTDFRADEIVSLDRPDTAVQIGWFHGGSWIKYSYAVATSGYYDVYLTYRCGSYDTPREITLDFGRDNVDPIPYEYAFNDNNWTTVPDGEAVIAAQNLGLEAGPGVLTLKNTGSSDFNLVGMEFQLKAAGAIRKPAKQRKVVAKALAARRSGLPPRAAYSVPGHAAAGTITDASGRLFP